MNVVVIGSRDRADTENDRKSVEELIHSLKEKYRTTLRIITIGCDKGIGKVVRKYCSECQIILMEARANIEGKDIPKAFFAHAYLARNKMVLEMGDEYYIFRGPNLNGIVEQIIPQAKSRVGPERVTVYDRE